MPADKKLIPVGISNRHFHVSQSDLETLYGKGYHLTTYRDISQKGQFASNETIDVTGPKGEIKRIRVVGPTRGQTQLEISASDAYRLGITPPVRYSGDLAGSAGVKLNGPEGKLELKEGIIVPQRHIHMNPDEARDFGVRDRDRVFVAPAGPEKITPGCESKTIIFGNVLIRVDATFVLDFHIDTDEANASGLKNGDQVYIVRKDTADPPMNKRLISESDVRRAIMQKKKIRVPFGAIVTPSARDLAKMHRVFEE